MSLDNNKEYANIRNPNYQLIMTPKVIELDRGNTSFMSVATNYLFAQATEHAQMPAKAGIKKFGNRAIASIMSEYRQLNKGPMPGKPVFGCINPDNLSRDEKKRVLEAANLMKKKRCGKIKTRTCAKGSK